VTDKRSRVVEFSTYRFPHRGKGPPRRRRSQALKEAIQTWGTFAEKHGSFANEHSTTL
jgi:hypothetical protein